MCLPRERSVKCDWCGSGAGADCCGIWFCTTEVNCWAWLWRECCWWCLGVLCGSLGSRSGRLGREGLAGGPGAATEVSCFCRAIPSSFCSAMLAARCSASFLERHVFEINLKGGEGKGVSQCTTLHTRVLHHPAGNQLSALPCHIPA